MMDALWEFLVSICLVFISLEQIKLRREVLKATNFILALQSVLEDGDLTVEVSGDE